MFLLSFTKFRQKTVPILRYLYENVKFYILHYPKQLLLVLIVLVIYSLLLFRFASLHSKENFIETWGNFGRDDIDQLTLCKVLTVSYGSNKDDKSKLSFSSSSSLSSSSTTGNVVPSNNNNHHQHSQYSHPISTTSVLREPYPRLPQFPFAGMLSANFFSTIINNNIVDNTFFFTIVHVKNLEYAYLVKNWAKSITLGTFTNDFITKRVIIADTIESCEILASIGVFNCYVDTCSAQIWLPIPREGKSGLVIYKYIWTEQALRRGYHVLYTDADAIFRKNSGDPLQYLVNDRLRYGGDGVSLPDIQMISDHGPGLRDCSKTDQKFLLYSLGKSSVAWYNVTYDKLYQSTGKGVKRDKAVTIEHSLPYLPCPLIGILYEEGSACVSSGFWYARATIPSVRFFRDMMNAIDGTREWEQKIINNILPYYLMEQQQQQPNTNYEHGHSPLKFIVLDPRVIGNINAQECVLADPQSSTMNVPTSITKLPRLITHMGYVDQKDKLATPKEFYLWYIEE